MSKRTLAKCLMIALLLGCLIVAVFFLLDAWDRKRGTFSVTDIQDSVLTYNGQEYVYKDDIETFLVLGLDRFEGEHSAHSHENGLQTDFLMLFVLDNETKESTAIHINRDTMTKVNKLSLGGTAVVESYTKQIALAYNYVADDNDKIRCRNTKDSVESLFTGAKVNHYLSLTMDAVPAGCDLVGGVDVTVLDDFTGIDDALVEGKQVTLTGEQALHYVRTRQGLEDSSNSKRMARQQQYINAFFDKAYSHIENDEEFLVRFVETMDDYVVYDSSDQRMMELAKKFSEYTFLGIREPEGETKVGEEFMEFYPDQDSIQQLLVELFYEPKG